MQEGLHAICPKSGGFGDQQPAKRHHQVGDVVPHLDLSREVWIDRTVSIELRMSRLRERPGSHAPSAGSSGWDSLKQLLSGGCEWLGDPSVKLQRPVDES